MKNYLLSVIQPQGEPPPAPVLDRIMQDVAAFDQELKACRCLDLQRGTDRPSTATVVRFQNGEVVTTDGPFAEGKEYIGGFWVIKAPDLDAALDWGRKATQAFDPRSRCGRSKGKSRTDSPCRPATSLGDRACIPRGVRPRRGRPGPRLRRHRRRRRGGPGRLHRRSAAVADPPGRLRARRDGSSPPHAIGRSIGSGGRPPATTGMPRRHLLHVRDEPPEEVSVGDDRLRLIFTCCHPALAPAAQVALTLRLLGGLHHRRDRTRLSRTRADHGAAAGPSQRQDPGRQDPLPGPERGRAPGSPAGRSWRSSISSSTRATRRARATGSCARTSAPKPSGWAGCWPS